MVAPLRQRGHDWLRNRGWAAGTATRTAKHTFRAERSASTDPRADCPPDEFQDLGLTSHAAA
jgi:hypothetical protein